MKSGYFLNLPVSRSAQEPNITEKVRQNIVLCHVDWNLDERSWGFKWDLLVSCIAEHNRASPTKSLHFKVICDKYVPTMQGGCVNG